VIGVLEGVAPKQTPGGGAGTICSSGSDPGVAAVFGPGATTTEIVDFLKGAVVPA
jgi:hypothetical protein